jgi:hypothetical protein
LTKRAKKINFNTEMETIGNEVESNQKNIFSRLIAGGTTNQRKIASWENVTNAVNLFGSKVRTRCQKKSHSPQT